MLILELLGPVAGKTLLDVGCGDGELASDLARRGAIVTGLDADPAMISAARRFDNVLAVTVLCFIRDAEHAVAKMARVLKPGGRLVIGELGRLSLWAMHRRVRGWLGNKTWSAARFRTASELRSLVQAAGLTVVEVRGAIHYPPFAMAAEVISPVDLWLGWRTTFGSAFIVISATKLRHE